MHTTLRNVLVGTATAVAIATVAGAPPAAAAKPAKVTVTIDAEGVDIFGTIKSPKPKRCADERTVKVFRLIDALEDLDDVQNVFSNVDVPDDVLAAMDDD